MFRPYMLAIVRLYFNLSSNCTTCEGYSGGVWGWGKRDLVVTTYRAETCNCTQYSCILTMLLSEIQLCSTVCIVHNKIRYWINTRQMTHLRVYIVTLNNFNNKKVCSEQVHCVQQKLNL